MKNFLFVAKCDSYNQATLPDADGLKKRTGCFVLKNGKGFSVLQLNWFGKIFRGIASACHLEKQFVQWIASDLKGRVKTVSKEDIQKIDKNFDASNYLQSLKKASKVATPILSSSSSSSDVQTFKPDKRDLQAFDSWVTEKREVAFEGSKYTLWKSESGAINIQDSVEHGSSLTVKKIGIKIESGAITSVYVDAKPTSPPAIPSKWEKVFASCFEEAQKALAEPKKRLDTKEILDWAAKLAKEHHKFQGYAIPSLTKTTAASVKAVPAIVSGKMVLGKANKKVPFIGAVHNKYTWKEKPALEAEVPKSIQNPGVHLPKTLDLVRFNELRKQVQQGTVTDKGISKEQAQEVALALSGVVIEATLPYKAGALLRDTKGEDIPVHCIFQTGLNFASFGGGGIPLQNTKKGAESIESFSLGNAEAAVASALRNKSDVLVFNLGIGTGCFGGQYGSKVKQANVDGLCAAVQAAKKEGEVLEVVVPDVGLSASQKKSLAEEGIRVVAADKGAVAALCARRGLTVSETIAADPMSMLGIYGPGFWWEQVGSASDEERIAFLTPCYALGHIPIDVSQAGKEGATKIPALSEFMVIE